MGDSCINYALQFSNTWWGGYLNILVGTLLATWMGSGSLFSGAGLGYRNGLAGLWSSGGAWLGIALIYFIAKRIRNFGKVPLRLIKMY